MEALIHLRNIWELATKEKRRDPQVASPRRPLLACKQAPAPSPSVLLGRAPCLPRSSLALRAAPGQRKHALLWAKLQYSDAHDTLYFPGAPPVPSTLPSSALTPSHATTQRSSHFEAEKHADIERWLTHQPRQTSPRACLSSQLLTAAPPPPPGHIQPQTADTPQAGWRGKSSRGDISPGIPEEQRFKVWHISPGCAWNPLPGLWQKQPQAMVPPLCAPTPRLGVLSLPSSLLCPLYSCLNKLGAERVQPRGHRVAKTYCFKMQFFS